MTLDGGHFSLAFSRALGRVLVRIDGPLDAHTAPELDDRLFDVIEGQGNRQLVLDLRGTTSVDSAGLSVLVDAQARLEDNGGELTLSGAARSVMRAIEDAGLEKVLLTTPAWAHPAHDRSDAADF